MLPRAHPGSARISRARIARQSTAIVQNRSHATIVRKQECEIRADRLTLASQSSSGSSPPPADRSQPNMLTPNTQRLTTNYLRLTTFLLKLCHDLCYVRAIPNSSLFDNSTSQPTDTWLSAAQP